MVVKSQQLLRTISFRHLLLLPRRESSFDPEDAKKTAFGSIGHYFFFLKDILIMILSSLWSKHPIAW